MRVTSLIVALLAVGLGVAAVTSRSRGQKQETPQAQVTTDGAQTVILNVPDMFCAGCEVGVKIAANKVDGVKQVRTDSDKRIVEVTFDPSKTTPQAIATAIAKGTGFKTEVAARGKNTT